MGIKNIYIETYGCAANQNNGEIISGLLARNGFIIVNNPKIADIIILNTCIVKGPTLQKMQSRIKELSNKKLVVTGCMPDVFQKQIRQINPRAILLSSHEIRTIAKIVKNLIENKQTPDSKEKNPEIKLLCPKNRKNPCIGITQISEGCLGNCTFCITRLAKGSLFSYLQEDIIENIENDIEAGCNEIWLTSQDCAAYGLDKKKKSNIISLLKKILKLKHNFFLRIGMSNPNHILPILDNLIECYKDKKMFKFLHIPLQSGSNEILRKMNRYYNAEDFLKIIAEFRKRISNISISTDIIVGFPEETDEDFKKTLEIIEKVKPESLNISRFWPMPRTPASRMKKVPDEVIKKRGISLREVFEKNAAEKNKKFIGKKISVLADEKGFDNTWICRTNEYKQVIVFSRERILGKRINVLVTGATPTYLIGRIVENPSLEVK